MYNSLEERALIQALSRQRARARRRRRRRLGDSGRASTRPARAGRSSGSDDPFIVYVGRIDANKGCAELFDYFLAVRRPTATAPLDLVLIGTPVLPIPAHPRIRHLGYRHRSGQVRRHRRRRSAGHAVVLREPVDGRARSLGARPAGACQRALRCPASASACAATPDCIMQNAPPSSPARSTRCSTTRRWPRDSGSNGRRVLRAPLQLAGDRAASTWTCSSVCRRSRRRRAMEPLPGWFARRRRVACRRRQRRSSTRVPARPGRGPTDARHVVKFAFVTPRYGADITSRARARVPAARRAGLRASRRRRADDLRARRR